MLINYAYTMNRMKKTAQYVLYWLITIALGVFYIFHIIAYQLWLKAWEKSHIEPIKHMQPPILSSSVYGSHKYFKRENVKIHYIESGEKNSQVVLLVHGVPGFWFCWRKQIPILANYFRVIALDLRGCGDSEVPRGRKAYSTETLIQDISYLIHNLGCSNVILVCCETSGYLGWEMASKYPQLISKLVLFNSPHICVIKQLFHAKIYNYVKFWYLLFLQIPLLPEAALSPAQTHEWLRSLLEPLVKTKSISDEEVEAYKYVFSRIGDWRGVVNLLRQIDLRPSCRDSSNQEVRVLTTPTLVIAGSSHPHFSTESAYRSAEIVERITVKVIQNGGKNLQVSHPQATNREILDFLNPQAVLLKEKIPPEIKESSFVGRFLGVVKNSYVMGS